VEGLLLLVFEIAERGGGIVVLEWWVVEAGIMMEVTRRRVLGLLGRMMRVRMLSALEAGVVASGTFSVM
jgi:hypothetical protein